MESMSGIRHRMVEVNGITMHVAETGEEGDRPVVLLIHGFPELWYSWRHQLLGLAAHGYRAVAPDLRGFGDTTAPPSVASYTMFHVVGDIVALLDRLNVQQVFVVGHDWGALISWKLCLLRPDRVKAVLSLGIAFTPRNPSVKPVDYFRSVYGDDYYICKYQGPMEEEFARLETKVLFTKIFSRRDPGPPYVRPGSYLFDPTTKPRSPAWLSEEDVEYYASKYDKAGFTGPLNYYRCLDLSWELSAPWAGAKVQVPVKFVVGDLDMTYHYPGIQEYIHNGGFRSQCPLLEEVVVMEGAGHFITQEKAHEITKHIHDFIKKF